MEEHRPSGDRFHSMQGFGQELTQFKVPFVGDANVGKTNIVSRYTTENFLPNSRPTVGVSTTSITFDLATEKVELSVWDTAGQERFRSLVPLYTRHAALMVIVFDMSSAHSFQSVSAWMDKLRSEMGVKCPIFVCGNKVDLPPEVTRDSVMEWAAKNDCNAFFTSAVTGSGVTELFQAIAVKVATEPRQNEFAPAPVEAVTKTKKCC
jgi:small GTP-binding protein